MFIKYFDLITIFRQLYFLLDIYRSLKDKANDGERGGVPQYTLVSVIV